MGNLPSAFSGSRVLRVFGTLGVGASVAAVVAAFVRSTSPFTIVSIFVLALVASEALRHRWLRSVSFLARVAIVVPPAAFFGLLSETSAASPTGRVFVALSMVLSFLVALVLSVPLSIAFAWPIERVRVSESGGLRARDHAERALALVYGAVSVAALIWGTAREDQTVAEPRMDHPLAFVFGDFGALFAIATLVLVLVRQHVRSRFLKRVETAAEPSFRLEDEGVARVLVRVPLGAVAVYRVGAERDVLLTLDEAGDIRAAEGRGH